MRFYKKKTKNKNPKVKDEDEERWDKKCYLQHKSKLKS